MNVPRAFLILFLMTISSVNFRAAAQEATAPAEDTSTPTTQVDASLETKQPVLMNEPAELQAEKSEYFFWITVVPEVGYIFFPQSSLIVPDYTANVDARNGFIGKVHFDMGGDGLAFDVAPMFAIEAGGVNTAGGNFGDIGVNLSQGLMSGTFQAFGAEFALVYRFTVGRFFPHLGLGFHGTYVMGKDIEYGTELYGRVPLGFTLYMGKDIGLVFEVGLMYGVTGIKTPFKLPDSVSPEIRAELDGMKTPDDFKKWYEDPENQAQVQEWIDKYKDELPENYNEEQLARDFVADRVAESIRFGQSFGIDITIGLRFP